ncbi:hypothetical protein ACN38_g7781 [Penicillium nordicum]|uniref:Uncharacterized protein n=1 Tax=Penicillium nordicum TaxID=229535 RepID=A0A0M8P4Y3_9EURO|nr:hypothetical protein ACN38_g7781 [Penicillium nordicum]
MQHHCIYYIPPAHNSVIGYYLKTPFHHRLFETYTLLLIYSLQIHFRSTSDSIQIDSLHRRLYDHHFQNYPNLQPAPGLASYTLGQKTIISEHYAQIDQAPIHYIVHDMIQITLLKGGLLACEIC